MNFSIIHNERSGGHAIINWLIKNSPYSPVTFYNNCSFINGQWHPSPKQAHIYKGEDDPFECELGNEPSTEMKVYSFEGRKVDFTNGDQNILIVREPRNWLASVMKNKYKPKYHSYIDDLINIYEFNLSHAHRYGYEILVYDRWFADENYRRNMFSKFFLQTPLKDVATNKISSWGGGSSFSGKEYQGAAQKMNVLKRDKELKKSPLKYLLFRWKSRKMRRLESLYAQYCLETHL